MNHQCINTSGHNHLHNNISYSVVNNPTNSASNSANTIQYKYQIGRPPLSSSNSASKSRIPLPSSPRNGIASAMNSNNNSSSNINYYLSGNHTTTNHNSISRQSSSHLRMNSAGGNNNTNATVRPSSLHSSRKNYCLHKNNSVYNLSKCIPSSATCSRPNVASINQQPKRNAPNVFKSYKVSSSSSYSTNASANKNAK